MRTLKYSGAREDVSKAGQIAARIVAGAKAAIGLAARGDRRVTVKYARQVPFRITTVDYLTLDLGFVPVGSYRLVIESTDFFPAAPRPASGPLTS